jgi:hypothetical protein
VPEEVAAIEIELVGDGLCSRWGVRRMNESEDILNVRIIGCRAQEANRAWLLVVAQFET